MKHYYPAVFTRTEDGRYEVDYLDFEDIHTIGDNIGDAYMKAQDALYNKLPEYKDEMPTPTLDYMDGKGIITLVELDVEEHERKKSKQVVKTTVTMPEYLKEMAEKKGINFSRVLQDGLKKELNIR